MNKKELLSKRNVEGLVSVVHTLIRDRKLQRNFDIDPTGTLEELGVSFSDKDLAKDLSEKLRHVIEHEIALTPVPDGVIPEPIPIRPFPDPVRPLPDLGSSLGGVDPGNPVAATAASTAVATAVATGVVSTVHSVSTSEGDLTPQFAFEKVKLDFTKVRNLEKFIELDNQLLDVRSRSARG